MKNIEKLIKVGSNWIHSGIETMSGHATKTVYSDIPHNPFWPWIWSFFPLQQSKWNGLKIHFKRILGLLRTFWIELQYFKFLAQVQFFLSWGELKFNLLPRKVISVLNCPVASWSLSLWILFLLCCNSTSFLPWHSMAFQKGPYSPRFYEFMMWQFGGRCNQFFKASFCGPIYVKF